MDKRVLILLLILGLPWFPKAAESLDFITVEAKSLALYEAGEWKELKRFGNQALKAGFDYYYLRMRIGIAYYQTKNYLHAIIHFEKALEFNAGDRTALEYLYQSNIKLNRNVESINIYTNSPPSLKESLREEGLPKLNFLSLETGPLISDQNQEFHNQDIDGEDNIYGETDIVNDGFYLNICAHYHPDRNISASLAYTFLSLDKTKLVRIGDSLTIDQQYPLSQHQVYMNANIDLGRGMSLLAAMHYINVGYKTVFPEYDIYTGNYSYPEKQIDLDNLAGFISFSKDFRIVQPCIFAGISNFNMKKQYQAGFGIIYFPLGNLDLYLDSKLMNHNNDGENSIIFDQKAGFKIFHPLWAEISATFGTLENYFEKNAYVVYNIPDKISFKGEARLIYKIDQKWMLTLDYQYIQQKGSILTYTKEMEGETETVAPVYYEPSYLNQYILGGIQWKF